MDTTYRMNQAHDVLDPTCMKALGIRSVADGIRFDDLVERVDNSVYGIPQRFTEEAVDIWVPFGRAETDAAVKGRDRIVLAQQTSQFKKYESGTAADSWEFTRRWVAGFASIDDARRYIDLCQNWTSTEEVGRAIKRVAGSLGSNESDENTEATPTLTRAIASLVRFPAENPKALKQFRVWTEPDIWICFYDLEKSKARKADIVLTSANVWYPPTYDVPERPKSTGVQLVDDAVSPRAAM
jgi:hypothetical protein